MHNHALLLLSTSSLTSASTAFLEYPSYGSGVWNTSYALSANANPNATKSVPFSLGAQNYTFQVNVAELLPTGSETANIVQAQPRIAASFYNLLWSGNETLNETLQHAWGMERAELCLTFPMGPLNRAATNGYREGDGGDCSNALGKDCMKDLAELKSYVLTGTCNARWMPKSCSARFGDGGLASSSLTAPGLDENSTDVLYQRSPRGIAWYQSAIHEAGNMSYYDREIERLHVIFLATAGSVTPVCTRVNTTRVGKNDDAVYSGAAESSKGSLYLAAALALGVTAFML